MMRIEKVSKPLMMVATLLAVAAFSLESYGKNRCEADLARVDSTFCLADHHRLSSGSTPLGYDWKVNDERFDLSSKLCLTSSEQVGKRRDLVLAIDRSESMANLDAGRKKQGGDSLSVARYIIDSYRDEAMRQGGTAPNIGLVMFAGDPLCREFQGDVTVNRDFPCLYIPARAVSDLTHIDQLHAFLMAAEGKYAQRMPVSSDYGIVADLLQSEALRAASFVKVGLVLLSNARSYKGSANDPYVHLRSPNYLAAQEEILSKFQGSTMRRYRAVFGLAPQPAPFFDKTNTGTDAYENMCQAAGGTPQDCDATQGVSAKKPETWPVNNIQFTSYAQRLIAANGGVATDLIEVAGKTSLDSALESLRIAADEAALIDSVAFTVNGGSERPGVINGSRFSLEGLEAQSAMSVDVLLRSGSAELKIPLNLATAQVPYEGVELRDKEMLCQVAGPGFFSDPQGNRLKNLQGGSASCGTVAGVSDSGPAKSAMLLFVLILPLGIVFFVNRQAKITLLLGFTLLVSVMGFGAPPAHSAEGDGLNALQFRPVVGGVANTEKAQPLAPGKISAGLFADYANDAVELGGEENKRVSSVMDDLTAIHGVVSIGVMQNLSLGVHMPFVHKSDIERSLNGETTEGGQLGRPGDTTVMAKYLVTQNRTFAFSIMPLATIPTGSPELLLGDGTANYGFLGVLSGTLGRFSWAYNAGYLHRQDSLRLEDERAETLIIRGQILNYGGLEYYVSSLLSVGTSFQAKFTTGERIDFSNSNPSEWQIVAKFRLLPGIESSAGAGAGIGKGFGSPDYRIFAGVAYIPGS